MWHDLQKFIDEVATDEFMLKLKSLDFLFTFSLSPIYLPRVSFFHSPSHAATMLGPDAFAPLLL
jgi:hypothetical protein